MWDEQLIQSTDMLYGHFSMGGLGWESWESIQAAALVPIELKEDLNL